MENAPRVQAKDRSERAGNVGYAIVCWLHSMILAGFLCLIIYSADGDTSGIPFLNSGYADLWPLAGCVPIFVVACCVWALYAWCAGAGIWTVAIAASAFLWPVILRWHVTDATLVLALALVPGIGAAHAGYAAARSAAKAPESVGCGKTYAWLAAIGTVIPGYAAISYDSHMYPHSTDFAIGAALLLLFLVTLAVLAAVIAYQLPRAWAGSRGKHSPILLLAVLIPLAALKPTIHRLDALVYSMDSFRRTTRSQVVSYVDDQIVGLRTRQCAVPVSHCRLAEAEMNLRITYDIKHRMVRDAEEE